MRLIFVDDDPENRRQHLELATRDWPDWDVRGFEDISQAAELGADIMVIDMSALTGVYSPDPYQALGPIISFLDLYPGAAIVIATGIHESYVEEIVESVLEATGNRPYYGGWAPCWDEELKPTIEKAAGLAPTHKENP